MLILRGPLAYSHFRIERWLAQINYWVPEVNALAADFVHFVDTQSPLSADETEILTNLLDYGGEIIEGKQTSLAAKYLKKQTPIIGEDQLTENYLGDEITSDENIILVVPKIGTHSAWSSQATDIAHHCGLYSIRRIERGILFRFKSSEKLTWGDKEAIAHLVYDPLTETILYNIAAAESLFKMGKAKPLEWIDIIGEGKPALIKANQKFGFDFSQDEVDYFFSQLQSLQRNPTDVEWVTLAIHYLKQHRERLFGSQWLIDGNVKTRSLFSMIKNTFHLNSRGVLATYPERSAIVEGGRSGYFFPEPATGLYHYQPEVIAMTVTALYGLPGDASGMDEEVRQEVAIGRGAKPKAGICGFSLSHLNIPGFNQEWETEYGRPPDSPSMLEILLEASTNSAKCNNEFGRATVGGYLRTFEQVVPTGNHLSEVHGYQKPLYFSGGLGNIRQVHVNKVRLSAGMQVIVLGGPGMRIGIGYNNDSPYTITAFRRENPEMQRRCQEVINACAAYDLENPIQSIRAVGRGGLANIVTELLQVYQVGGRFELRNIPCADSSLSPLEIWCNEAEERYILVIPEKDLNLFQKIADRQYCPFAIIGEIINEPEMHLHDRVAPENNLSLPLSLLTGDFPYARIETTSYSYAFPSLKLDDITVSDAAARLLRFPCIADKSFLINIVDRGITGLIARDPMVGPWQVPVADCAVTARGYDTYQGEATSIGERSPLSIVNPIASARMAIGEAITNIAAANIGALSDVRLCLSWAATNAEKERKDLYDAVQAVGMELCPTLGLTVVSTQDSFAGKTAWKQNNQEKIVVAPLSILASTCAPVMDVRRVLTPLLSLEEGDTILILIDLSNGHQRLGQSCLEQVYQQVGGSVPDVENPQLLKDFFALIQQLHIEDKILAYHDRSDGGLFVTLCEMAFASHVGLTVDISELGNDPLSILFNEELGAVIQIRAEDVESVLAELYEGGLPHCQVIANLNTYHKIEIFLNEKAVFSEEWMVLQQAWSEMGFRIQSIRDNPRCAKKQFETIQDREDPGLNVFVNFDMTEDITAPYLNLDTYPRIAVLSEQGVYGQAEMAAAFTRAQFDCIDVHMNDLQNGLVSLDEFKGLVVGGGFSFGDVLGAGLGWAKRILFTPALRDQFTRFFERPDTFTLGVSNGCQMLSRLTALIPGTEHWPIFIENYSEQFEARLCTVEVQPSPSIFLKGMEGSRLLISVAHHEGRVSFAREEMQEEVLSEELVTLRYVDNRGRKTKQYPANPNGSPLGITGLCSRDGRVMITIAHPERGFRSVQYAWHPKEWGEEGPWLRLFRNARKWVD